MKKTVLSLLLGLSSTALAGGNDGILITKFSVPIIIDGPSGPIVVGPGGTDGHIINDLLKGGVEMESLPNVTPDTINHQNAGLYIDNDFFAAIPSESSGTSALSITSLKYVSENGAFVTILVNHKVKTLTLTDAALAFLPSLSAAIVESAKSNDWVDVK